MGKIQRVERAGPNKKKQNGVDLIQKWKSKQLQSLNAKVIAVTCKT
jgi:hypothetical protein